MEPDPWLCDTFKYDYVNCIHKKFIIQLLPQTYKPDKLIVKKEADVFGLCPERNLMRRVLFLYLYSTNRS